MATFKLKEGPVNTTVLIDIIEDDVDIGHFLLVPYSPEMYQIHLSPIALDHRGHTSQIGREFLECLFTNMERLQKVIAMIPVHNKLTIKLVKDCGFKYEGKIKDSFLSGNQLEDQLVYGISKENILCR